MKAASAFLRQAGQEADRLPALIVNARRAAASLHIGTHGLRRAGPGETFWQHRDHQPEEGLAAIDWRRSARSDRLFARDREREAPALFSLWADQRAGMQWSSNPELPLKSDYAVIAALALGMALRAGGERVAALGQNPSGRDDFLAQTLLIAGQQPPLAATAARRHGVVIATDGLESVDVWEQRFLALRSEQAPRLILLIADPAEEEFHFEGRVLFHAPAAPEIPYLVGHAQAVAPDYQGLWRNHRAAIVGAARACGFTVADVRTDRPLAPALLSLARALQTEGGR